VDWLSWVAGIGGRAPVRPDKPRDPMAQLVALLHHHAIDLVLDVGANAGQYGARLRRYGYGGRLLSFEPLASAHAALSARARDDAAWEVAPAMALGERDGEVEIGVSAESDMSSLLAQNDLLRRLSPSSVVQAREKVAMRRLDGIDVGPAVRLHLKVDVQGYEPQVLAGAAGLLDRLTSLQLEMALVSLYQGERDWRRMIDEMDERGFDLHLVLPGYFERKLARQLQMAGVFVRREPSSAPPRCTPVPSTTKAETA